jgi:hypothetical protein
MGQDMSDFTTDTDEEFTAMHVVYTTLAPLDEDARNRVVDYILARFEITTRPGPAGRTADMLTASQEEPVHGKPAEGIKFESFAELYDAAQPKNQGEKALVAGYWLQICQGSESVDGFSANKELKNLGEGVGNITHSYGQSKESKTCSGAATEKEWKESTGAEDSCRNKLRRGHD